jgi:hypothetical protein
MLLIEMQMSYLKDNLADFYKIKYIYLSYDPTIPLKHMYPREMKTCICKANVDSCFIHGSQPKVLIEEWIKIFQCIQRNTVGNTKDEMLNIGNNVDKIQKHYNKLLSKISQAQQTTGYIVPFIWHSRKVKSIEIKNRSLVACGLQVKRGTVY